MVDAADVRDILQERPDLEGPMKAALELDEPWTFEDIDTDSGEFGELVSHGVIEETAEGYHVTDQAAVRLHCRTLPRRTIRTTGSHCALTPVVSEN